MKGKNVKVGTSPRSSGLLEGTEPRLWRSSKSASKLTHSKRFAQTGRRDSLPQRANVGGTLPRTVQVVASLPPAG
jgi:hypothetical protein